ncbi:MAG: [protein-PII] uridylyltransferase [Nitrospirae bacterium]|nr:[protein-PII] uridylyltransferase [Nitrospirota bacterium]
MATLNQILEAPSDRAALISDLKTYLRTRREEIRRLHEEGSSGHFVLIRLTSLIDTLITEIYQRELARHPTSGSGKLAEGCAVVAVGGYGRGELNPYSDIDIMFLYRNGMQDETERAAMEVLYLLWDLQFTIGHSTRTIAECVRIARSDITAKTALMEARLLTGSETLFEEFQKAFRSRVLPRRPEEYIEEKRREMRARHLQYGSSICLVEPNVKESPGGLRDVHFLQWVAMARYGVASPSDLHRQGYLTPREYRDLVRAQEFLWRVRNEMHFHTGRASDVLTFEEQKRLADVFHYADEPHRLGVERFMRRYYIAAARIHDVSSRFIERATPVPWRQKIRDLLLSRRVGPFTLSPRTLRVSERRKFEVLEDGGELLRLFYLAQIHGLRIDSRSRDLLHRHRDRIPRDLRLSPAANRVLLEILSWPRDAANTLRLLHRARLLQKLIPEFARVDRMVQYDHYHKYTVDEHTFLAVEKAQNLLDGSETLAKVYREIRRKDILLLGILLHDIGKGGKESHSVIGAKIAERLARQLGFSDEETGLLVFLVHYHLIMSHIAFRRDLADDKVIVLFARQVAKPEVLKKLFILTCADIQAVGPDTWTEWKKNLLTELFHRTMEELTGARVTLSETERIERIGKEIGERLCLLIPQEWLDEALADMETRYLLVTSTNRILGHLYMIRRLLLEEEPVLVDVSADPLLTEFTLYTYDVPGLFSKVAGVLAAVGYNILGAQVYTSRKGIVVDTFQVQDPYPGEESARGRREAVRGHLREVLTGRESVENLFARRPAGKGAPRIAPTEPTIVEVDNESSDAFSIIDVFAADKQGLLYVITRTLHDLGLSICSSKIATKVDQIVDVFYVRDLSGEKVTEPERVQKVKTRLREAIDGYGV